MPALKQFLARLALAIIVSLSAGICMSSYTLAVVPPDTGSTGPPNTSGSGASASGSSTPSDPCADTNGSNGNVSQSKVQKCVQQSPIVHEIQLIVDWLSAGVGIVITGVIIAGGIQYSLAGDNANAVEAAKQRMLNGVIALFAFLFMFAFLQWLIPGGIFK